jgi:hypothetical protein
MVCLTSITYCKLINYQLVFFFCCCQYLYIYLVYLYTTLHKYFDIYFFIKSGQFYQPPLLNLLFQDLI